METLFTDAKIIACDWKKFYRVRLDLAIPGLYTKTKRFRFLKSDTQETSSLVKYANRARIPVALRIYFDQAKYPKVLLSTSLKSSIKNYVDFCSANASNSQQLSTLKKLLFHCLYG